MCPLWNLNRKLLISIKFFTDVFKLPEIIVVSNNNYLIRDSETQLECRINGQPIEWANTTIDRLIWIKDGTPINELALPSETYLEKIFRFNTNNNGYNNPV